MYLCAEIKTWIPLSLLKLAAFIPRFSGNSAAWLGVSNVLVLCLRVSGLACYSWSLVFSNAMSQLCEYQISVPHKEASIAHRERRDYFEAEEITDSEVSLFSSQPSKAQCWHTQTQVEFYFRQSWGISKIKPLSSEGFSFNWACCLH